MGYKMPCPYCNSNKFVDFEKKTGYKSKVRSIAQYKGQSFMPVVCGIGTCKNKECPGPSKDPSMVDSSDRVSDHTFHLYSPQVWSRYPRELQERYKAVLFFDVADGKDGQVFVSEDLCNEVLRDSTVFSHLARELREHHQRIRVRAVGNYIAFVERQSKNEPSNCEFPEFNLKRFDGQFDPPGEGN
jgi:hypothetical protein